MQVHVTADASTALAESRRFLETDPVGHNLVLTLLHLRAERPQPGRYAWATSSSDVIGVLFQSPLTFAAAITPMPRAAAEAIALELATVDPPLPGVNGEAATAAALAGTWATAKRVPVEPVDGQRLYRCDELVEPAPASGAPREAAEGDLDLLTEWMTGFQAETGDGVAGENPREATAAMVASRPVWLWEDPPGSPACMIGLTRVIAGVGRVGPVYTPPDRRGRGYAASLTAFGTRSILDGGNVAALYTQLANPTSNALYQRLGYHAVSEVVRYSFA